MVYFKMEEILEKIISQLKQELEAQGHKLTGTLERSLTAKVVSLPNGQREGQILGKYYAVYLEEGVPAKNIPFSPGSGKKYSKYIAGLIRFFELRGRNPVEAKRAAFATAHKQKRYGLPTPGSYLFAKNGRRTLAIRTTVRQMVPEIERFLAQQNAHLIEVQIARALKVNDLKLI